LTFILFLLVLYVVTDPDIEPDHAINIE